MSRNSSVDKKKLNQMASKNPIYVSKAHHIEIQQEKVMSEGDG